VFLNLGKKKKSKVPELIKTLDLKGTIWNSCIDSAKDLLVVETRDSELLECRFYVIDLKKKEIITDYQYNDEKWWIGLKYAFDGYFVLYTYEDEQNPISKGIIVVDGVRGVIRWRNENYSFLDAQGPQIMVTDTETKSNMNINIDGGRVCCYKECPPCQNLKEPVRYLEDSEYFEQTASLIEMVKSEKPSEFIEYLEWEEKIILSYCTYIDQKQVNNLVVLDTEGKLLQEFNLSTGFKGISFGDYVVYKELLLFAIEGDKYQIVDLSQL